MGGTSRRRLGETGLVHERSTAFGETDFVHEGDESTAIGETGFVHDQSGDSDPIVEPGAPAGRGAPAHFSRARADKLSAPAGQNVLPKGIQRTKEGEAQTFSPLVSNETPFQPFDPLTRRVGGNSGAGQNVRAGRTNCPAGGDRFPISLQVLADPEQLDGWFEWALERRWVRDIDRVRVFALARSVVRRSQRPVDPVGVGAFVRCVKRQLWKVPSQQDEDWARRAIQYLDRRESGL